MSHQEQSCGCEEYLEFDRRSALRALGRLGWAAAASLPAWMPRLAFGSGGGATRDLIVCVFLRGGADALTLCVPHGDPHYYASRSSTAVPRPDALVADRTIDLDTFFGFPPALDVLVPIFNANQLTVVHAIGMPDPTRSHFRAMDRMEAGTPGANLLPTGWLGRHLANTDALVINGIRGMSPHNNLPRALRGGPDCVAIPQVDSFGLRGRAISRPNRAAALQQMYTAAGAPLSAHATAVMNTISRLEPISGAPYIPSNGAVYPDHDWGRAMQSVARVAKAEIGLEVACVDFGGWDTHADQVWTSGGPLYTLMRNFALCMAAFHADMYDRIDRTTVVVMSEFGRRIDENYSGGTDHGHGGLMFLMGGAHVNGGRVWANWPTLHPDARYEGLDLDATLDYRDILSEILVNRAGSTSLDQVFPGYSPSMQGIVLA